MKGWFKRIFRRVVFARTSKKSIYEITALDLVPDVVRHNTRPPVNIVGFWMITYVLCLIIRTKGKAKASPYVLLPAGQGL